MNAGRIAWFVAGAGVGAYAAFRARRVVDALSPEGLRDRAEAVKAGARVVATEVAQARVDKETELRERFGLPSLESKTKTMELEGQQ
ncbi:DUF6167 family protein [Nocardioides sp.]|uniref:DUF6167 family protein n=1 Tax=Nocardioides sp. TaxID=35761 RepID=UPI0039E61561